MTGQTRRELTREKDRHLWTMLFPMQFSGARPPMHRAVRQSTTLRKVCPDLPTPPMPLIRLCSFSPYLRTSHLLPVLATLFACTCVCQTTHGLVHAGERTACNAHDNQCPSDDDHTSNTRQEPLTLPDDHTALPDGRSIQPCDRKDIGGHARARHQQVRALPLSRVWPHWTMQSQTFCF